MRIAICDDEQLYREEATNLINDYTQAHPELSFRLFSFSSGKELLEYIDENGSFDLYVLDIIMPEMNGIELGAALRSRKDNGMVIYLTTSPEFAVESYNIEAFHYLLKPIDAEQFFKVIEKAVKHFYQSEKEVLSIKTSGSVRIVLTRNIRYAARMGRLICYYMSDDTTINSITFNDKFVNAAAPLLSHNGFLLVGSSFVVNLYHVTEVTRTELVISGGHRVSIPRRIYESVKSEWANYWLNGGMNHVR